MAFQKLNSLRSIAQSLELRACSHRRRDDSFILELVLSTVGRLMGPPDLLPHARYLLAIFVSLRPVQVAKLLGQYINHSCGVVRSFDLYRTPGLLPPHSNCFPLTFRHIRLSGTINRSKCIGFDVIGLAARLHLYQRLSRVLVGVLAVHKSHRWTRRQMSPTRTLRIATKAGRSGSNTLLQMQRAKEQVCP